MPCKVLLQQVRRDWDSMVLGVRRGHGGAIGLSQTPCWMKSIGAGPPVIPLLGPTTVSRWGSVIGIRPSRLPCLLVPPMSRRVWQGWV